jgi:hypothetical protein
LLPTIEKEAVHQEATARVVASGSRNGTRRNADIETLKAEKRLIMGDKSKNQGEGDRESAKRFNKNEQEFVKSGKVDKAARKAGEGDEQEMERAEKAGKERAKELDPGVDRNYSKPTK